jgi:hypothetical protein
MKSASVSKNLPINTFSNFATAPKDYNRINLTKNGCALYQLNGGGRDTYIYNDNGGFCQPKEPTKYAKPGRMLGLHSNSKEKFPQLIGRPCKYLQNGTGRDTYILTNHGGFDHSGSSGLKDFQTAFKDSLRGYQIDEFYLARHQKITRSPRANTLQTSQNFQSLENSHSISRMNLNKTAANFNIKVKDKLYTPRETKLKNQASLHKTHNFDFGITQHLNANLDSSLLRNGHALEKHMRTIQYHGADHHDMATRSNTISLRNRVSLVKMRDAVGVDSRTKINDYIRAMDDRLSVPKFRYNDESPPTQSCKKFDKCLESSTHKMSTVSFVENKFSTEKLRTIDSKMLLHNASSELMKSQERRQEENRERREKSLTKIAIDKRDKLFKCLQRGRNLQGGVYGRKMHFNTLMTAKFQHSQNAPTIIRGSDNVHPNIVFRQTDL